MGTPSAVPSARFATLADLATWLRAAPAGLTLSASALADSLAPASIAEPAAVLATAPAAVPSSWREKLWTVPAETRVGVRELAEAMDRPRSWVYRHTGPKCDAGDRLPHRRLDGECVFVAGEVRQWIAAHEEVVARPPKPVTPTLRRA